MSAVLVGLLTAKIVTIRSYLDAIGSACVELHTDSGRIVSVRSGEVGASSFEAFCLEIAGQACPGSEADPSAWRSDACKLDVGHIEVFRRDEWREAEAPKGPWVGSNPVSIDAGPVGSAPPGTEPLTVVCGLLLQPRNGSQAPLLIYISDHPGLLMMTTRESEIVAYRKITTSEAIR
jgi:hypothetical protein